jgi:hypothetical protein
VVVEVVEEEGSVVEVAVEAVEVVAVEVVAEEEVVEEVRVNQRRHPQLPLTRLGTASKEYLPPSSEEI